MNFIKENWKAVAAAVLVFFVVASFAPKDWGIIPLALAALAGFLVFKYVGR